MAENKLLPCPFCGSTEIEIYEYHGEKMGLEYGGFFPECANCGCRLNYYESRGKSLEAWNRRAKDGRE